MATRKPKNNTENLTETAEIETAADPTAPETGNTEAAAGTDDNQTTESFDGAENQESSTESSEGDQTPAVAEEVISPEEVQRRGYDARRAAAKANENYERHDASGFKAKESPAEAATGADDQDPAGDNSQA